MYSQFKSFFNKHDIFYQKQYGFRDHCSTEHTILDIVNKIQENLDKGKFLCGALILLTYKKRSTLSIIISSWRNLITMSEFVLLFMIGFTLIWSKELSQHG